MCEREKSSNALVKAETPVEASDLYYGTYGGLVIARKRAHLCSVFFACSSTVLLLSHFVTPRVPINLGPLGNSTL